MQWSIWSNFFCHSIWNARMSSAHALIRQIFLVLLEYCSFSNYYCNTNTRTSVLYCNTKQQDLYILGFCLILKYNDSWQLYNYTARLFKALTWNQCCGIPNKIVQPITAFQLALTITHLHAVNSCTFEIYISYKYLNCWNSIVFHHYFLQIICLNLTLVKRIIININPTFSPLKYI